MPVFTEESNCLAPEGFRVQVDSDGACESTLTLKATDATLVSVAGDNAAGGQSMEVPTSGQVRSGQVYYSAEV